jgi:hypothetical protein
MTQEEKELLVEDISGRLQSGLKVCCINLSDEMPKVWDLIGMPAPHLADILVKGSHRFAAVNIEESIRPYLRPMSSMTEEEWKEYDWFIKQESDELIRFRNTVKFYNKHHIDYNGLIEKDLALEAPEEMYVIK